MLVINDHLTIDEAELDETFIRSPGPGGQNVNKVASAVQLRFDVAANRSLTPEQKRRLRMKAGRRMSKAGVLILKVDQHRSQAANREEARRRLAQLIRESLTRPTPRIPTRPTKGSVERRLESKRHQAQRKSYRSAPKSYD